MFGGVDLFKQTEKVDSEPEATPPQPKATPSQPKVVPKPSGSSRGGGGGGGLFDGDGEDVEDIFSFQPKKK